MNTRQIFLLSALFVIAVLSFAIAPVESQQSHINIVQIQDSINPGVEDFMKYAIKRSVDDKAECLIILLDTPGGLMTSMRGICSGNSQFRNSNRRLCISERRTGRLRRGVHHGRRRYRRNGARHQHRCSPPGYWRRRRAAFFHE